MTVAAYSLLIFKLEWCCLVTLSPCAAAATDHCTPALSGSLVHLMRVMIRPGRWPLQNKLPNETDTDQKYTQQKQRDPDEEKNFQVLI